MEPDSFQGLDEMAANQTRWITGSTWHSAEVFEHSGRVAELYSSLPHFSRQPFRFGDQENRFKDQIVREPISIYDKPMPIGTVGKDYALIQHREVLASVFQALKLIGIDISDISSNLLLSEYGERMQWSCHLPGYDFDPGDENPIVLRINCLNSVDASTIFDVSLRWYRLICSNGMMFGLNESRFRHRHIKSLDPDRIADYLQKEIKQVPGQQSLYTQWLAHSVALDQLEPWVDQELAKAWGPHIAARTWSILCQGMDGEVEPAKDCKPHELTLKHTRPVPGSCAPVRNIFHVSQALSWIAGTRNTITEQLDFVKAIPGLIEPLIKPAA